MIITLVALVTSSCAHKMVRTPQNERVPTISFTLTPISMDQRIFKTEGHISPCVKQNTPAKIFLPPGVDVKVSKDGRTLKVDQKNEIIVQCEEASSDLLFKGKVRLNPGMCEASDSEIYCRPNSYPNPEVYADRLRYNILFNLPSGITALIPDPSITLNNGILFQLGKFKPAKIKNTTHFTIEYIFPENFNADVSNFPFIEETLESYFENFGPLSFDHIRIGAIKRGEKTNEITGNPGGNLILFSRTAFGASVSMKGLDQMGITRDLTDAFRKMIISHELSHFWFSDRFLGLDGWMTEGIPNYLGLMAVKKSLPEDFPELLKMFKFMDKKGLQTPIPNRPFGEGDDYIKAYYQGPLALYRIGESIGQEELIHFIVDVYRQNSNPNFNAFESLFLKRYPDQEKVWREAWRINI